MDQNVPRRLNRFYRNQNNPQQQQNYSLNQPATNPSQNNFDYNQNEDNFNPGQSRGIPSMDYSDINLEADKKNMEEMKKLQEKNLVEKLALDEVQKFKVQNNRMPNSKEEEQIAENLFTQLKNETLKTEEGQPVSNNQRGRNRKANTQNAGQGLDGSINDNEPTSQLLQQNNSNSQLTDMKDLFGEDEKQSTTKGKQKDEFDMDLGEMDESESISTGEEELTPIEASDEEKKICPNCKKPTEKIIYCSKCGTAFCLNCAKTQGTNKLCPKCSTKVKI